MCLSPTLTPSSCVHETQEIFICWKVSLWSQCLLFSYLPLSRAVSRTSALPRSVNCAVCGQSLASIAWELCTVKHTKIAKLISISDGQVQAWTRLAKLCDDLCRSQQLTDRKYVCIDFTVVLLLYCVCVCFDVCMFLFNDILFIVDLFLAFIVLFKTGWDFYFFFSFSPPSPPPPLCTTKSIF